MANDRRILLAQALERGAGAFEVEARESHEQRVQREHVAYAYALLDALPVQVNYARSVSERFTIDVLRFADGDYVGRRNEDGCVREIHVVGDGPSDNGGLKGLPFIVALALGEYRDLGMKTQISLARTRPMTEEENWGVGNNPPDPRGGPEALRRWHAEQVEPGAASKVARLFVLPYSFSHPNVLRLVREG